jgi:ATP-grasp domain
MTGDVAQASRQVMPRTYALLTDGSTVEVRPARPEDAEVVRAMHAALSPENLYLRFFSLNPHSPQAEAVRVTSEPGPAALAGLLLRVSRLADELPEVAEFDLNPVIATQDGVQAVAARIRVSPARPRDPFLRQLR